MEQIIEMLSRLNARVDFRTAEGIITQKLINSIDITELIPELEDVFDVQIGMDEMTAENFDSAEAIWNMILRLQDE